MDIKKSMSCKTAKFFKTHFLDCPDKIKKAMNEDNGERDLLKRKKKKKSSRLGLVQSRDIVVCQHTITAAPSLRHAIAVHLRYAKSRGKWQR